MNKYLQDSIMTQDGRDWLISALDPFHDYQQSLKGYPDLVSLPSNVQMHNGSLTISAPGVATWDCSICFTGFDTASVMDLPLYASANQVGHSYDSTAALSTVYLKSLMVLSANSGTNLSVGTAGVTITGLDSRLSGERGRLIGVAYEVHNVTAEVYRQGSVLTATLQDNVRDVDSCMFVDSAAVCANKDVQQDWSALIPSGMTHLRRIPSAGTWDARKGVYCIPRMTWPDVPITEVDGLHRTTRITYVDGNSTRTGHTGTTVVGGATLPIIQGAPKTSFAPTMSLFAGLSPETTLRITFRTIVEYFPDTTSALLYGSSPSTIYDASALQAYSRIAQHAPYAVPVNENAAGDYFRKLLKVANQVAPYVTGLVPAQFKPVALAAAAGLKGLDAAVDQVMKRRDERKKRAQAARKKPNKPQQQQQKKKVNRQVAGTDARATKA